MISTDVELAVARLRAGGVVAIPTETVYGLAANAQDADAVDRIFEIKGRPSNHPLILHIRSADDLPRWAARVPPAAAALADACWPGPLTMLVERSDEVLDEVTGGRPTVGVRVPSHPMTQALLESFGGALAAPSANRFGKVSPTTARHVLDDLGDLLDPVRDLILDGGSSEVGIESTIVDLTVAPPQVLRTGAITVDDLDRLLEADVADAEGPSRASGMLASHYAPLCDVVTAESTDEADDLVRARRARGEQVRMLDRTDDLVVAARRLYADLRAADRDGLTSLVVVMPPAGGLGHALRDRLLKAAAATQDPSNPDG